MQSARAHTPLSLPHPPPLSDRAAERRAGLNLDYVDVDAALAPAAGPPPALAVFAAPAVPLTAEETKFLGGDTAHTHLVKGLDYALLARVRSERAQEEVGVAAPESLTPVPAPAAAAPPPKPDRRAATLATSLLAWLDTDHAATAAAAARAAARAADAGAAPAPPAPRVPTFLPHRTAYVYELGEEGDDAGLGGDGLPLLPLAAPPTTLARAAADCPRARPAATAAVDAALLKRLAKILAYVGGGAAPKKGRKAARAAALAELQSLAPARGAPAAPLIARTVAPRRPVDDDDGIPPPVAPADEKDDIFGAAGRDYEAAASGVEAAAAPAAAPADAPSYFGAAGGASVYADLPPVSAVVAAEAAGVPVPAAGTAATRRPPRPHEEEEDAYAELYPDAGAGFGDDMYSDDEEGGRGGEDEAKGEADKKTGNQPSARARERAAGAKLDSELAQIKTLLEKDGADVEAAFSKAPRGRGKGGEQQQQAEGGDGGGGGGAPTKRRRLAAD